MINMINNQLLCYFPYVSLQCYLAGSAKSELDLKYKISCKDSEFLKE